MATSLRTAIVGPHLSRGPVAVPFSVPGLSPHPRQRQLGSSRAAERGLRWLCLAAGLSMALSGCSRVSALQKSWFGSLPATTKQPTVAAKAPKTTPTPAATPDIELIGLSQPQAVELFGTPSEQTDRDGGKSWTWRAPRCAVELLFYLDLSRNDYYVLDRRVFGTDGSEREAQLCLRKLQHAKQG